MAAKLKDGLFLGDFEAAQDMEFILANKITRVINCAGREVGNMWERSGVKYLTYFWPESGNCIIFDESNAVLDEIYGFIEEALESHDSVLIHSIDGASRACFCSAVYFILKYRWTLEKTLKYLQSKRPDLSPRPGFMRQLFALDQSLQRLTLASVKSKDDPLLRRYSEWDTTVLPTDDDASDELLLANTFLNSHSNPAVPLNARALKPRRIRLSWIDDPRRRTAAGGRLEVPISPYSRRPTPERPPTPSYNALAVGPGWVDTLEGKAGPSPARDRGPPDARHLRSLLKNSGLWKEQRKADAAAAAAVAMGRASAGSGSGRKKGDRDSESKTPSRRPASARHPDPNPPATTRPMSASADPSAGSVSFSRPASSSAPPSSSSAASGGSGSKDHGWVGPRRGGGGSAAAAAAAAGSPRGPVSHRPRGRDVPRDRPGSGGSRTSTPKSGGGEGTSPRSLRRVSSAPVASTHPGGESWDAASSGSAAWNPASGPSPRSGPGASPGSRRAASGWDDGSAGSSSAAAAAAAGPSSSSSSSGGRAYVYQESTDAQILTVNDLPDQHHHHHHHHGTADVHSRAGASSMGSFQPQSARVHIPAVRGDSRGGRDDRGSSSSSSGSRGFSRSSGPVRATVDLSGGARRVNLSWSAPRNGGGSGGSGSDRRSRRDPSPRRGLSSSFSDTQLHGGGYDALSQSWSGGSGSGSGGGGGGGGAGGSSGTRTRRRTAHQRRGATPPRRYTGPTPGSTSLSMSFDSGSRSRGGGSGSRREEAVARTMADRRARGSPLAGDGRSRRSASPAPQRSSSSSGGSRSRRSATPQPQRSGGLSYSLSGLSAGRSSSGSRARGRVASPMHRNSSGGSRRSSSARRSATVSSTPDVRSSRSKPRWVL